MGILSSTVSMTRYMVKGQLDEPVMESILKGLKKYTISEIDSEASEKSLGWTSFESPYSPDFDNSSFLFGTYLVFSLRVDRKSIPPKILNKHITIEKDRRLAKSDRKFISSSERKMIKEQVMHSLCLRVPATPNVYDLIWNYEEGKLWFFSSLKSANEDLEDLFSKSFNLSLIRLFPYTAAELGSDLSDSKRDQLHALSSTMFTG